MNKVLEGLFIGNFDGANDTLSLQRNGVTHILTAAGGLQPVNYEVKFEKIIVYYRDLFGKDSMF